MPALFRILIDCLPVALLGTWQGGLQLLPVALALAGSNVNTHTIVSIDQASDDYSRCGSFLPKYSSFRAHNVMLRGALQRVHSN